MIFGGIWAVTEIAGAIAAAAEASALAAAAAAEAAALAAAEAAVVVEAAAITTEAGVIATEAGAVVSETAVVAAESGAVVAESGAAVAEGGSMLGNAARGAVQGAKMAGRVGGKVLKWTGRGLAAADVAATTTGVYSAVNCIPNDQLKGLGPEWVDDWVSLDNQPDLKWIKTGNWRTEEEVKIMDINPACDKAFDAQIDPAVPVDTTPTGDAAPTITTHPDAARLTPAQCVKGCQHINESEEDTRREVIVTTTTYPIVPAAVLLIAVAASRYF